MQKGSFNAIRLAAALVVFHSHMFAISGRAEPIVAGGLKLGAVSVGIFFVVSGYLVAQSALHRPIGEYATARLLRVLPGLAVCTIVSILLGAVFTTLPLEDYVASSEAWGYLRNVAVFWTPVQARLPGVFLNQPIDHVNGSLWTLPYEILCYVALGLVSLAGRKGVITAIAIMATLLVLSPAMRSDAAFRLFDTFELRHVLRLGSAFALGAALGFFSLRTCAWVTSGLAAAALCASTSSLAPILFSLLYGSLAVLVGRGLHLDRHLLGRQDVSYGVYIYAFPFQQSAVALFGTSPFALLYGSALMATLTAAVLSWVIVERPLIERKEMIISWVSARTRSISSRDRALSKRPGSGAGEMTA